VRQDEELTERIRNIEKQEEESTGRRSKCGRMRSYIQKG
jgi:hypothetical protein